MRKYIILAGALAAVIAIVLVGQLGGQKAQAVALTVKNVGADPAAYVGEITITGVKTAVSRSDATIFGIMDVTEMGCTKENCSMVLIPIKFEGQQPAMGDEVLATGTFTQSGSGYMFTARDIQVVRNHKLGG